MARRCRMAASASSFHCVSRDRDNDFGNGAVRRQRSPERRLMLRAFLILVSCAIFCSAAAASVRVKDIATLQGVRDNQLVGYGLVVGLQGTGDTLTNSTFTQQALQSMLDRMGINVRALALRTRNVAAVVVT